MAAGVFQEAQLSFPCHSCRAAETICRAGSAAQSFQKEVLCFLISLLLFM